jgi:hypothetical protein
MNVYIKYILLEPFIGNIGVLCLLYYTGTFSGNTEIGYSTYNTVIT